MLILLKMQKAPEHLSCGAAIKINDLKLGVVTVCLLAVGMLRSNRICHIGRNSSR